MWKWLLGGVVLVAVVGLTVVVTISVIDGNHGKPPNSTPPGQGSLTSEFASAADDGPVTIITEEPTCEPMAPIVTALSVAQKNGWDRRDPLIPASSWTPEVKAQYESAGEAMRTAADRLVPLAKVTPHRVMRELYQQSIAYLRLYANSIPSYTPRDDELFRAANAAIAAITNICSSIELGSAAARAPLVRPLSAPERVAPLGDAENPQPLLAELNPVCGDWANAVSDFQREAAAWAAASPEIPAGQWSPEQKALNHEVVPVMTRFANRLLALGSRSGNAVWQDFADLSAIYRFAYVEAIPTYMPADKHLTIASMRLSGIVNSACKALD